MDKLDSKFYGELRKAKNDEVVPDEEWMAFLAKDNAFAMTLPIYRTICVQIGCDQEHIQAVDRTIERMRVWREAHPERLKNPDALGEKLLDRPPWNNDQV